MDESIDAAIERRTLARLHGEQSAAAARQTGSQAMAKLLAESERDLASKSKRVEELETQTRDLQLRNRLLEETNRGLERVVREMETFLADYGLVWVGSNSAPQTDRPRTSSSSSSSSSASSQRAPLSQRNRRGPPRALAPITPPSAPAPSAAFSFDPRKVKKNVDELNRVVGDGIARVTKLRDGSHQLRVPDPVRVAVFRDGIFVMNGPFRSFESDKSAVAFVRDIVDGYFPSELQQRFPDGVPLVYEDHCTESFDQRKPPAPIIGSTSKPAAGAVFSGELTPRTKFERSLPVAVIKNGQVVPVRKAVMAATSPSPSPAYGSASSGNGEPQVESTPVVLSGKASKVITFKVRIDCTGAGFVVKACADDAVATVRDIVARQHPAKGTFRLLAVATNSELQPTDEPISTFDVDRALVRVVCECDKGRGFSKSTLQ